MATFGGRTLEGGYGAVLYLQEAVRKTATLDLPDGIGTISEGSRAAVLALSGTYTGADETLEAAVRLAQKALDIWATHGVRALTLAAVEDVNIVWWVEDDEVFCRIQGTVTIPTPIVQGHVTVTGPDGKPVPFTPGPQPKWHPSFRFFRLGQATTDLVEAFRNFYLALESLLSTLEPIKMGKKGHPEREGQWLDRVLPQAADLVDFTQYMPAGSQDDPIESVRADIYAGARTATFHAKDGARVLLPHDAQTHQELQDVVVRLRRLYMDLAQKVLEIDFSGGMHLASALFQAMVVSGMDIQQFYVSGERVDSAALEAGQLPSSLVLILASQAEEYDEDYYLAYTGKTLPGDIPDHVVRQFGTLRGETNEVGLYESLEAELNVEGFARVHLLVAAVGPDPRAWGTRYTS